MSDQASPITPGRAEWTPLWPPPRDLPKPPGRHMKRGEPERIFTYRDADNAILGYVYRFKRTEHAGYELIPLTFCQHGASGDRAWRWVMFPGPRPLYGLQWALPDLPVLICTDELQADYAYQQLGMTFWPVSWPGGGPKTFKKADWSAIEGREVYILPDDTTTPAALAQYLIEIGISCVVAQPKSSVPAGWDVGEATLQGWDPNDLTTFAVMVSPPPPPGPVKKKTPPPQPGSGDWRIGLLYAESGKLIDCRENVIMILQRHPAWQDVIGLDEFANRVMIRQPPDGIEGFEPQEWSNDHDVSLGLWFAQQDDRMLKMIVKSTDTISQAVNFVASKNRFNPVRDYIDGLEWDGQDRLPTWLSDYLGVTENEYSALVGTYWMLGMVARVYEPGCQMRIVLVLEGEQWKGKSTALRTLGGEWFADSKLDLNNKDAYQAIQGKLLYEIPEFDSFNRAEFNTVKAFISSVSDHYRPPYERRARDWPRQGVFACTVNGDEYFRDPTGNTRFAPVRTTDIRIDLLAEHRDQLFAEARVKYQRGDRQYPTREELERLFKGEQDEREISDPWVEIIGGWLKDSGGSKVTIPDVLAECLKIERGKIDGSRSMAIRVGHALKRAGWRKAGRESGNGPRYYIRPPAPPAAVSASAGTEGSDVKPF
jgi:predicted P-loop ATPase